MAQSQSLLTKQLQFSKTALLTKLESDLVTESGIDCSAQMQTSLSEATTKLAAKKKRNRLRANSSFKGGSALELIKEDITDPEQCSPVERLNTASVEQHRRSPRRMPQKGATNSDSDEDDVIKEQIVPPESRGMPPPASRKRTRTIKSRLMALHNQMPAEDYDGDYEDEVPPSATFNTPDKVFDYAAARNERSMTTLVEVHNSLKRSRSSDSSVEMSNDSVCLIPETSAVSSVRKLSADQHSVSSPSITLNLKHSKTDGLSNSLKFVLLKGHSSSYESTA